MTNKRCAALLAIVLSNISFAHAVESTPADNAIPQKTVPSDATLPAPTSDAAPVTVVETRNVAPVVKTRDDVIAELIKSKQDGSYIAPSEIYPLQAYPQAVR